MRTFDVGVVGAGPAGLAVAIALRLRGLDVVVCEQKTGIIDKACGEGIMPKGRAVLKALGVDAHLNLDRTAPIVGIRYINEDGRAVSGRLAPPQGLGVRRVALSQALMARAAEVGVVLVDGHKFARERSVGDAGHVLRADGQSTLAVRFVIAADGLLSPLRQASSLAVAGASSQRFGLRQHFAVSPWTDHVEVYFSEDAEAYVTPVGRDEIGVAFLFDAGSRDAKRSFATLLAQFPALARKLDGAVASSSVRGAGPLAQRVERIVDDDFALLGDAAGYVDAITGEGISLALSSALILADEVAVRRTGVMHGYARRHRRIFARYAWLASALLWISRRARLRRVLVSTLSRVPKLFERLLRMAI